MYSCRNWESSPVSLLLGRNLSKIDDKWDRDCDSHIDQYQPCTNTCSLATNILPRLRLRGHLNSSLSKGASYLTMLIFVNNFIKYLRMAFIHVFESFRLAEELHIFAKCHINEKNEQITPFERADKMSNSES
ncbi:hypothetical protein ACOME3_009545 [Neoechinorhynchus agilis]